MLPFANILKCCPASCFFHFILSHAILLNKVVRFRLIVRVLKLTLYIEVANVCGRDYNALMVVFPLPVLLGVTILGNGMSHSSQSLVSTWCNHSQTSGGILPFCQSQTVEQSAIVIPACAHSLDIRQSQTNQLK